jgi:hypothetical protein
MSARSLLTQTAKVTLGGWSWEGNKLTSNLTKGLILLCLPHLLDGGTSITDSNVVIITQQQRVRECPMQSCVWCETLRDSVSGHAVWH